MTHKILLVTHFIPRCQSHLWQNEKASFKIDGFKLGPIRERSTYSSGPEIHGNVEAGCGAAHSARKMSRPPLNLTVSVVHHTSRIQHFTSRKKKAGFGTNGDTNGFIVHDTCLNHGSEVGSAIWSSRQPSIKPSKSMAQACTNLCPRQATFRGKMPWPWNSQAGKVDTVELEQAVAHGWSCWDLGGISLSPHLY